MTMRIVVEPGSYGCHNMGDVAMMQVAVKRLNELWPEAVIEVITSRPGLLSRYCPAAIPLSMEARNAWLSGRSVTGPLQRKLPAGISSIMQRVEMLIWLYCPAITDLLVRLKTVIRHRTTPSPSGFRKRLTGASLVVISGAGALNDAFADSAYPLLDELDYVLKAGIPVVAFGQGIGPITNPELMAKLRAVLPRFKLIGLREGHVGLQLLASLRVASEKIHVTGDDTIELVYQRRKSSLGNSIGVNLRHSGYADTNEEIFGLLRESLRLATQALNSSLVSVPISFHESESDVVTNGILLDDPSTGSETTYPTPEEIIYLIGKCRVVVTGSYHAGVFAVAQGIPVVCLVQSPYYEQKFIGLQEQFPAGCRILDFRQPVTSGMIQDAIRAAWESAEQVREPLLVAAARQIELSRAAYQTARELIPLAPVD